jgi:glutamyl-tRNA(Gln) amidotransferase subunit E
VRVVAGLDRAPILHHSEDWPEAAAGELAGLRVAAGCEEGDSFVLVWGPERDTKTAAEEIRIRYAEATDGVPHETRQPFADGSTDFERILPGPDRMYPDTDSPPTRVTRERVERLRQALAERPWDREARYAAAGVPASTSHFLIRRGGAALVDHVVSECGADLRHAAFLFGERVKGLDRAGTTVDELSREDWCALFQAFAERPALRDAWAALVIQVALVPPTTVPKALNELGYDRELPDWREQLAAGLEEARETVYDDDPGRLARHAAGVVMRRLRGHVPARTALEALKEGLGAER